MSEKKDDTESTVMGLPQVVDPQVNEPTLEITAKPELAATTAPTLDQVTAPSLPPVLTPPSAPPRTKTGGVIPKTDAAAPRKSRVGQAAPPPPAPAPAAIENLDTTEISTHRNIKPVSTAPSEGFEWTMPKVAGLAGAVSFLCVLLWVFWPSGQKKPVAPVRDEPVAVAEPIAPTPKPKPVEPVAVPVAAPKKPTFAIDAKTNVIDPYAAHLPDLELDPAHKYRLRIERDDSRLGTALARLDEKEGWGVMRKMASHAVLQFGGAKALRLHCEPGSHFDEGQALPLELVDLANKKKTPVLVNPATHCWDFEVARMLELGEGVKKRVRVPSDAKLELGEKVPLRVAYILEALGEKKSWRTGVLGPGESVLAEGRFIRFAILDAYAGDNEGTLELELLSGDTESSGLVTPSAAPGAEFVVPK